MKAILILPIKLKISVIFFLISMYFSSVLSSFSFLVSSFKVSASDYGITNTLIFSKILSNAPNIDKQNIGGNYFLVSDEDENFYVESIYGFYKYDKFGNFVCATPTQSVVAGLSNLVYANSKIYAVSKSWPYKFNIYSTQNCTLIKSILLYTNNESTPTTDLNIVSDITVSRDSKFVAFFSYYLSRIYIYSIDEDTLKFDQVKTTATPPVLLREFYTKAPMNLDESKFFAVNQQTGEIIVFDYNNIATYISSYGLRGTYQNLRTLSTGGNVPFGLSKDNIITAFNKYLCIHPLSNAQDMKCTQYIDSTKGEGNMPTSIVSNLNDTENNFYLFTQKQASSSTNYYLNKYSSNVLNPKSIIIPFLNLGGLFADGLDNIVTTSNTLNVYDKDLTEIFSIPLDTPVNGATYTAYFPNILGASDSDVPAITPTPSPALPYYLFPMYLYRTSAISETPKGNFYIYQEFRTNLYTYIAKIYKFKGDKKVIVDHCPLKIYCNSTPKHCPIILIHGLGGSYKNWFDDKTGILRTSILNNFHENDPDFPDSWIHSYSYGYNFNNEYNYQGKIEDISSNLHFDVQRLSDESKAFGGDGKVDLIGYSLGGLVARHYILEKTGYPGTQNLESANHNIGKLILIASPVNGSTWLARFNEFEEDYPKIGFQLKKLVNTSLSLFTDKTIDLNLDIGNQLPKTSTYISSVNSSSVPLDVDYYRIYSNLKLKADYNIFDKRIYYNMDLGDLAVLPEDTKLNTNFKNEKFDEFMIERKIVVGFDQRPVFDFDYELDDFSQYTHPKIYSNSDTINYVLNLLKSYENE